MVFNIFTDGFTLGFLGMYPGFRTLDALEIQHMAGNPTVLSVTVS